VGGVEARGHRADANPEDLRDTSVVEVRVIAKKEHEALALG